ncbi:hypothetical protein MKL09_29795 [Methylobacterium sp. J-048]|uniref:hypothetical protein n=1 Tax=Methylobacterium sp. J-048 TaxID=2836635 RepID=UPI001FBBC045|nr:hypothetical protein [Methylobacterium sp. J-048]MCJ2060701.1 hypothetical protein [Methylobacterium sp. J-048]
MRSLKIALLGVVAATGFGALASMPAQAQDGFGPGRVYSVGRPLPIRVRPRSWLDAGNVPLTSNVPGAGGSRNPALNPYLIAASNQLTPVYGRNDRFDSGQLPDPITNGPFIGARSSAVRNVDLSFVDRIDPTSPLYGRPY